MALSDDKIEKLSKPQAIESILYALKASHLCEEQRK